MADDNATLPPADITRGVAAYLSEAAYYTDAPSITTYLKSIPSTFGTWTLQWGPVTVPLLYNSCFVASNQDGLYVVAVQGTIKSLAEYLEDSAGFVQKAWPYPESANAECAAGSYLGFYVLSSLYDGKTGTKLFEFLNQQAPREVLFTGHSLGGGLANLMIVYLAQTASFWGRLSAITFAAPTITDGNFKSLLLQATKNGVVEQWQNEIDVVPMAWDNVNGILNSFAGGPQFSDWDDSGPYLFLVAAQDSGALPTNYVQLPNVKTFSGQGMSGDTDWEAEVFKQHNLEYYMSQVIPQFKPLPLHEQPEFQHRKKLLEQQVLKTRKTLENMGLVN